MIHVTQEHLNHLKSLKIHVVVPTENLTIHLSSITFGRHPERQTALTEQKILIGGTIYVTARLAPVEGTAVNPNNID